MPHFIEQDHEVVLAVEGSVEYERQFTSTEFEMLFETDCAALMRQSQNQAFSIQAEGGTE